MLEESILLYYTLQSFSGVYTISSFEYLEADMPTPCIHCQKRSGTSVQTSSINGFKIQVAGYWHREVFSFMFRFTPTGCSELWDAITELAAGAKVRLYKPADEPSKSQRGAAARLLKVVSY